MLLFVVAVLAVNGVSACFMDHAECPPNDQPACTLHNDSALVVCCHITSMSSLMKNFRLAVADSRESAHLFIGNATLGHFNASLSIWRHLKTLTVKNSTVNSVQGKFRGQLDCFRMSNLSLSHIDNETFSALSLSFLDLSANNLTFIPVLNPENQRENLTVDFSNNGNIFCTNFSSLIDKFQERINFASINSTLCLTVTRHGWFDSPTPVTLNDVIMIKQLERDCPKGEGYECNCGNYIVDTGGKSDIGTLVGKVNCSGQNLTRLPPHLPPKANILDVSHNRITSIDILTKEETYRGIRKLYADHNQIANISSLEGSHFIKHFVVLSLRKNKLTSIPTYVLAHAFNDKSSIQRTLLLGENKFICNCNNANDLKDFVRQNLASIKDSEEVKCADEQQVKYLDLGELCNARDWSEYLPVVIGIEVFLLVVLISKVSYDYWVFKTKGYLPWPASKMPKLPCDWVCETL